MSNMDEFYALFNGKDNISGTNTRWLEKQLSDPSSLSQTQIAEYNSELGRMPNGQKKPRTCWNYVRNGSCGCTGVKTLQQGCVFNRHWHPCDSEREYLRQKIVRPQS